jgi:hypothetical protein
MLRSLSKPKMAWENRFKVPTLQDLRAGYNRQLGGLVDMVREQLFAIPGVREEVAWHGIPWRWSLAFRCPLCPAPEPALVFLIPQPAKPQLCVPLPEALITILPARQPSRGIREAVVGAFRVNGFYWAQWDLANKPQTAEILDVVRFTHAFRTGRD